MANWWDVLEPEEAEALARRQNSSRRPTQSRKPVTAANDPWMRDYAAKRRAVEAAAKEKAQPTTGLGSALLPSWYPQSSGPDLQVSGGPATVAAPIRSSAMAAPTVQSPTPRVNANAWQPWAMPGSAGPTYPVDAPLPQAQAPGVGASMPSTGTMTTPGLNIANDVPIGERAPGWFQSWAPGAADAWRLRQDETNALIDAERGGYANEPM